MARRTGSATAERTRSRRNYEEEEEEPTKATRSRRSRAEEEEEDEPRRDRKKSERGSASNMGKGWGGATHSESSGEYTNAWKLPTKRTLVKLLDSEPFINYSEHWIERKGKKSWTCLGNDCPLCDSGFKATSYSLFNILDLSDPDNPKNEYWRVGKTVFGVLKDFAADKKTSPLDREDLYFAVWRTGDKNSGYQTNINPVKARDVEDDYDCTPLSAEELDEYREDAFDEDVVYVNSKKELAAIADED